MHKNVSFSLKKMLYFKVHHLHLASTLLDFIGLPSINEIQLLIGNHGFYFNENIGNIKIYKRTVHIKFLF
jgi:hypothetical protein